MIRPCGLHHVTYAGIKFEVGSSKGLGGDTFTRNLTDRGMHGSRTDEINVPFFSKEKSNEHCVLTISSMGRGLIILSLEQVFDLRSIEIK